MNESNKACEWFCWNNSCSRQMGYLGTKNTHNSGSAQKFSFFLKKTKCCIMKRARRFSCFFYLFTEEFLL